MQNLMRYKKIYLLISALVLLPGLISLVMFGLRLAVDFTGGSVFTYDVSQLETDGEFRQQVTLIFNENKLSPESLAVRGDVLEIKTHTIDSAQNDLILASLQQVFPDLKQKSFVTIGPSIGRETTKNAFKALGIASLGIMLYIAYAFRNIPKPYSSLRFGASAVIAMLHDAFLLIGVFSILGKLTGVQVDALFITAALTVIGFSVHDSIVVFDRIRENLRKLPSSWSFEQVVDFSVAETLNRSVATSLTVLITLLSLYILGGESIKYFVLALLIGIISGTYSSIFTASPILVLWEDHISSRKRGK